MALRRIDNPPNPYTHAHADWLEPPPEARLEVFEERTGAALSHNDSPDIPFRWSLNPYRGCQHACAYCYARPTHEYLGFGAGTDFDSKICVKINAPEALRERLSRPSWRRELIAFSGVTDCYQPLEAVYQLTRRCLEVCVERRNPVGIVTKSFLIVRDAELLAELNRVAEATVYCSIPFADDALARQIESGAPAPSRRFEAMRRLHAAGVPVAVMVAPLIPGLNDREIPAVLKRAAECGARSASFIPLRLPGAVREVFFSRLAAVAPQRVRRVEAQVRAMRGGRLSESRFGARMRGAGVYWEGVRRLFAMTAQRLGMTTAGRPVSEGTEAPQESEGMKAPQESEGMKAPQGSERTEAPQESEGAARKSPLAAQASVVQLPLF